MMIWEVADYVKYYRRHYHDYHMSYYTSQTHAIICECGSVNSIPERHAVAFSDANDGDRKAICLGCGALLNLNIDSAIIANYGNEFTANGSYVFNGIIILVEEDINAYLNGDLEFYKKNDEYLS